VGNGASEIAAADGEVMVAKKEGNNKRGKLEEKRRKNKRHKDGEGNGCG